MSQKKYIGESRLKNIFENIKSELSKYITKESADASYLPINENAGAHNCIYRGKYLGSAVTDDQYSAISSGKFTDLYIGDYWTINNVNYRIAAFDYYYNTGDTACTTHHAVIVPDTCLDHAAMNSTNTTDGAYGNSEMHKTNLESTKTIINNAFDSSHILNHRIIFSNKINSTSNPAYETDGLWYDCTVELMSERMVYGADIFHNIQANGVVPYNYTIEKTQLPLFALESSRINIRNLWWLRDVCQNVSFANVGSIAAADQTSASKKLGVRPFFCIC